MASDGLMPTYNKNNNKQLINEKDSISMFGEILNGNMLHGIGARYIGKKHHF